MNDKTSQWKPNVTVAAVVERGGAFLLVEEQTADGVRYNQPAGHLEAGESLVDAVIRETLEESAWRFTPSALIGVYQYHQAASGTTYLRFAFAGELSDHDAGRTLDTGILRALWMPVAEIRSCRAKHRSPLLMQCVDDYLAGRRHPLEVLHHHS
ncbi:MAG: NUDIX hydrolase [Burkholderiales bacterium]|jgi:ADP-ribose pyrophosphatase YjhB (NUDIX family)|nr:NUDIX hydrolase [Burkholderiales bacterium]